MSLNCPYCGTEANQIYEQCITDGAIIHTVCSLCSRPLVITIKKTLTFKTELEEPDEDIDLHCI